MSVQQEIAELPTAFLTELAGNKSGTPAIAFRAEYDALSQVGHACGHHIIGNAAPGAGAS